MTYDHMEVLLYTFLTLTQMELSAHLYLSASLILIMRDILCKGDIK